MPLNKTKNTVQAAQLPVNKLRPFEGHPFKVTDDAEMEQLVYSILTQGLLTPITVRPLPNDEYEVISGHRRLHACQKAGIETVPALIYSLDRDAATIAMVDSNLHREKILPSEKAFAYKLKMEAMSRQGHRTDLTSDQVGPKLTAAMIAEDESASQVKRYGPAGMEQNSNSIRGNTGFEPAHTQPGFDPQICCPDRTGGKNQLPVAFESGWQPDHPCRNDC